MARADRVKGRFQHYGVLVVPVMLDGIRLEFMVDTGASFCSISRSVATRVGIDMKTTEEISMVPASGAPIHVPLTKINLKVGINAVKNLNVAIFDFPSELRVDGLLGMNFLKKFRFTIEPDTATLILREIPQS